MKDVLFYLVVPSVLIFIFGCAVISLIGLPGAAIEFIVALPVLLFGFHKVLA